MMTPPALVSIFAAMVGALLLFVAFRRAGGRAWPGALVGLVGGALGSALFMVPLNYCTFEAERSDLDRVFGVVLVAAGVALVTVPLGWLVPRLLRGQGLIGQSQSTLGTFKNRWLPLLLLAPTLFILILFLYYPSVETMRLSTQLARLGARREVFVCVDNFTRLIENPTYLAIVFRTLWMSSAIVFLSMALALMVAMAAYLPVRGATIYRTLLIWPYGISPAVAGIIFLLMFNPTGGIINYFTGNLFGVKLGWTNDPLVAPWTIILASVWKSMGFNILFYIAGLQNVPKDLLEAASIDGANAVQRFRRVLIPMLSPITFFLIVTNVTYAFFETYATIDYLTPGGGPLGSTTTMMYEVIRVGVSNNDLGKAAAQSIVLFMLVIGLTLVQFRAGGRRVTYGA